MKITVDNAKSKFLMYHRKNIFKNRIGCTNMKKGARNRSFFHMTVS